MLSEEYLTEQNKVLGQAKEFFESLQAYNTPGKLKNFKYSVEEITGYGKAVELLDTITILRGFISDHGTAASWLSTAEAVLPSDHDWTDRMKAIKQDIMSEVTNSKSNIKSMGVSVSKKLNELKDEYIKIYTTLHTNSRLGTNDDKRKARLMNDPRLKVLQKLAGIDLMPRQQLTDFQNRLGSLRSCFSLTEQDLSKTPVCPHCGFRPSAENQGLHLQGSAMLSQLDEELDIMLTGWCETILENLEDPITQSNLELLKTDTRGAVDTFIKTRELPEQLEGDFVNALREVLSGLIKVVVKTGDLKNALRVSSGPAAPVEMKKRFDEYIDGLTKGKDPAKVRIVME